MINLRNVSKYHERRGAPPVHALSGVSLDIAPGEFTAILGPSGSGKSTLLNVIGLLDRPTDGTYLLEGREVGGLGIDQTARLRNEKFGFVFQAFHLLPRTTALENVELPLLYTDNARVRETALGALEAVGLEHRADHYASELSGGEQQRVAIARALVNGPSIVLADEPTGNLDSHSAGEIMTIFEELNRRGTTVLLITHDAAVAARASRRVRIADGRIAGEESRPASAAGAPAVN